MIELPDFYFRLKDNGATVFAVVIEEHLQKLDLKPIAQINMRNNDVRPQGDHVLSDKEQDAIEIWMAARREKLAAEDKARVSDTIDQISHLAHWAQSTATDDQLEEATEALLMAMFDLRNVLTRKKADRLGKS